MLKRIEGIAFGFLQNADAGHLHKLAVPLLFCYISNPPWVQKVNWGSILHLLVSTYKISTPRGEGLGEYPKDSHHGDLPIVFAHMLEAQRREIKEGREAWDAVNKLPACYSDENADGTVPTIWFWSTTLQVLLPCGLSDPHGEGRFVELLYCTSVSCGCNRVDPRRPLSSLKVIDEIVDEGRAIPSGGLTSNKPRWTIGICLKDNVWKLTRPYLQSPDATWPSGLWFGTVPICDGLSARKTNTFGISFFP